MKKSIILMILAAFVFAPAAFAQTGIGIGWDNGYSIKIPVSPVCIQLTGKFDSVIPEDDDADTETDVEIAAYVSYPVIDINDSKFNVFGGFGLVPSTREMSVGVNTYDKELDFLFRFGFEPEYMVSDNIGVSGKAALEIMLDQGYDGLDDSGSTDIGTWGSLGIHWYF